MSPGIDPYRVLGVSPTSTQRELQAAFRRLAKANHPDAVGGDKRAEQDFKSVARAWEMVRTAARRRAYDAERSGGRFAGPGQAGRASFEVDSGDLYHSDLGHHSDFYQAGDPLTVAEAAELIGREPSWLRRAIRTGQLPAASTPRGYLLRRRDVERLDRAAARRPARPTGDSSRTGA
jgi:excisionase family DNA binding protein